jgi:hypothetical protein
MLSFSLCEQDGAKPLQVSDQVRNLSKQACEEGAANMAKQGSKLPVFDHPFNHKVSRSLVKLLMPEFHLVW